LDFETTVVAVGNFDGVHCGHRLLIKRVAGLAQKHSIRPVILTMWPHPRQVINQHENRFQLLNTLDERINLLKQTGIDDVIVIPFDNDLAQMSPSDFVNKIIIGKLKARYLVAGQDHHFGKKRAGNMQHLSEIATQNNLKIEVVDLKKFDHKISSTAIREALLNGDLSYANQMLGYEYIISGKVISGNQLGRSIGFPTANIKTHDYKLLPKNGVYRVKINTGNNEFNRLGMAYIGKRNVLNQKDATIHIEVNIFDFDQQIYDQDIAIALTHRIRDDMKFENIEQLAEQLRRDRQKVLDNMS